MFLLTTNLPNVIEKFPDAVKIAQTASCDFIHYISGMIGMNDSSEEASL